MPSVHARLEMPLLIESAPHVDDSPFFPRRDGSRVPYDVFRSEEIYDREQARIFRGPTWSFLGLEAELPNPGDFKSTFVGDTPVVVTRKVDGGLAAWVNSCAHRGAIVCRQKRGNAKAHTCVYHQWSFDPEGNLRGVPFRNGQNGKPGMPPDFDASEHGLQKLRVASYRGLVFATFSETVCELAEYIGPEMLPFVDRIFDKPVVYLGCTRQFSKSNWKLYTENIKDPYHASLLHLFHTTFNILRIGMSARCIPDATHGLHSIIYVSRSASANSEGYKKENIRSFNERFVLEDPSLLDMRQEYEELTTNHIQSIFPQLVIQQIHNTLVARQLLPKGPNNFELVFHFFGYADDDEALRKMRIVQANLVGPAGYISMEDTEATELVQRGTRRDGGRTSTIDMGKEQPDLEDTLLTESLIRKFWVGYRELMEL